MNRWMIPAVFAGLLAASALLGGCAEARHADTDDQLAARQAMLRTRATDTIARFRSESAAVDRLLDEVVGYAVFPRVTRGGAGIGGSHGAGTVYERGTLVGYADLYQATIGAQVGAQTFSELVLFEDEDVLRDFKRGLLELSAGASAVVLDRGQVGQATFRNGVAVVTMVESGVMLEMAVGGQTFRFSPEFESFE